MLSDYVQMGHRTWGLCLHEKNGNYLEIPSHHALDEYIAEYIEAAGIAGIGTCRSFWQRCLTAAVLRSHRQRRSQERDQAD